MRAKRPTRYITIMATIFLAASLPHTEGLFAEGSGKVSAYKVYKNNCAKCHGSDGRKTTRGKSLGAPDFTDPDWQASVSDAQIVVAITNGKKKMPSWKGELSAQEIMAVGKFLRVFGKKRR